MRPCSKSTQFTSNNIGMLRSLRTQISNHVEIAVGQWTLALTMPISPEFGSNPVKKRPIFSSKQHRNSTPEKSVQTASPQSGFPRNDLATEIDVSVVALVADAASVTLLPPRTSRKTAVSRCPWTKVTSLRDHLLLPEEKPPSSWKTGTRRIRFGRGFAVGTLCSLDFRGRVLKGQPSGSPFILTCSQSPLTIRRRSRETKERAELADL